VIAVSQALNRESTKTKAKKNLTQRRKAAKIGQGEIAAKERKERKEIGSGFTRDWTT
jgi:hypothetical protein